MSYTDAIHDFIAFMEANGVKPVEPIAARLASGSLIRFRCEGDGKGRLNGWAILYLDERPAGAFGNYRLNTGTLKWKASDDRPALTPQEREALQREWRQAKDRREAEQRANQLQAALDAKWMWKSSSPASPDHPYAVRKLLDVSLTDSLRQLGDQLLVPMWDSTASLWNIQRIAPDGEKRFLRGGRCDDLFCLVGSFTGATEAVICEGYASADAIHRVGRVPVIAAMSGKNMARVARIWHEHRPDLSYIVFGDDDRGTEAKTGRNPGREFAYAAAREIGARVTFPLRRAG